MQPADPGGAAAATPPRPKGVRRWLRDISLKRVFRSAGVLLSGSAAGGLLDLGAFALTARALGPEVFGVLVLIQTYVQLVTGLAKFQSWQALIHYGSRCLQEHRRDDFQGLIKFTSLLDVGSAVLAAAAAVLVAPLVVDWFGWRPDTERLLMLYSVLILFTVTATPTGILRLFDRFDLLAKQAMVGPALRLIGSCALFLGEGGLLAFLLVWLAAGVADRVVLVAMGWREIVRRDLGKGMTLSLRRLVKPHPGLWRFVWTSNFSTTLFNIADRATVLVVGWMLGPAAAGLFKVAKQFTATLIKPVTLLGQTIYPELAKLSARGGERQFRRLVLRAGLVAGGVATLAVAALALLGEPLIRLTVGDAYLEAYTVMVLLALASAVWVFGFPLGPAFYASGRPGLFLTVNLILTLATFVLLLVLLDQIGLIGAGLAALARRVVALVVMGLIVHRLLADRGGAAEDAASSAPRAPADMPSA